MKKLWERRNKYISKILDRLNNHNNHDYAASAFKNTRLTPEYLHNVFTGLKNNFKGMGVVVDVYDNDGKRNNPTIGVRIVIK
jgi:hypothetical protein